MVIPGQMIQRIMTGMPSCPYNGRHENDSHEYYHDHSNSCTNTTTQDKRWQDSDPDDLDDSSSMDGTYNHHARVEMKYLTHTHPLKQRIGIDTDVDPMVIIRLNLMIISITMGGIPMTVAIVAPLTHPAC